MDQLLVLRNPLKILQSLLYFIIFINILHWYNNSLAYSPDILYSNNMKQNPQIDPMVSGPLPQLESPFQPPRLSKPYRPTQHPHRIVQAVHPNPTLSALIPSEKHENSRLKLVIYHLDWLLLLISQVQDHLYLEQLPVCVLSVFWSKRIQQIKNRAVNKWLPLESQLDVVSGLER